MKILLKHLTEEQNLIVLNHFSKELYKLLIELEKYKLCTNQQIIQFIQRNYNCEVIVPTYLQPSSDILYNSKYNIYYVNDGKLTKVYLPIDNIVSSQLLIEMELEFGSAYMEYYCITPYNFELLGGNDILNYNLAFRVIVAEAVKVGVSNIHIDAYNDGNSIVYPIRYRINDILIQQRLFNLDSETSTELVNKLISRDTKGNNSDLITDVGVTANSVDYIKGSGIDLRVTANKAEYGIHCHVRVQTKNNTNRSIEDLGFDKKVTRSMNKNIRFRNGLILYAGAKSTGKNTSAYAVLRKICKRDIKIISYEAPIEVDMPFTQIAYNTSNPDSLLSNIVLAKKQDIDIVFLNEIPNKDVAFAVKDLVTSSIGVITTIHIDRLWHLPYRLYEYYGSEYKDVISQLRVVYVQKMFNIVCSHCSSKVAISDLEDEDYRDYLKNLGVDFITIATGCSLCDRTISSNTFKIQPYCEFIEFTSEIKSNLLHMETAWEMELYLKELLIKSETNFEYFIKKGVQDGLLDTNAIDQFL